MSEARVAIREQTGADAGRVHHLPTGRHVLGRDAAAAVQLRSADVSRQHAVIEVSESAVVVTDLGSKNGVLLKREKSTTRLTGPTALADGAVIEVGGIDLLVAHPGLQVDRALMAVGEATITRMQAPGSASRERGAAVPLMITALFASLVGALLWLDGR